MYQILRPFLFKIDPEKAHTFTLGLMGMVGKIPPLRVLVAKLFSTPQTKPVKVFGLVFKNRIGLAAGYDKDGTAWKGLASLGFGHIEVGTVTPQPQIGNPKPRIFRLIEDQAVINRMGFPSQGADFTLKKLSEKKPKDLILGVNIGKNKDTPLEEAYRDYISLIEAFSPMADYITINISSPNTIGLRKLQNRNYLETLLSEIGKAKNKLCADLNKPIPLLIKLSPDMTNHELQESLDTIQESQVDGIIATNTTISRKNLSSHLINETGGLSGVPLTSSSTEMTKKIWKITEGKIPIIAAGGIMSATDAKEKLDSGASLIQIFTGLIYRGPNLVKKIIDQTDTYHSPTKAFS